MINSSGNSNCVYHYKIKTAWENTRGLTECKKLTKQGAMCLRTDIHTSMSCSVLAGGGRRDLFQASPDTAPVAQMGGQCVHDGK